MENQQFLTVSQVAEMLQISRTTVYIWSKIGILKPYHITKRTIRFKKAEIVKSLKVEAKDK